jgi:hypothetical protein
MSQDQEKPLRLFVDPFAAWRELAFKTAEMIAASAQAGVARASGVAHTSGTRVAVIDERPRAPAAPAPKAAIGKKKHKKKHKTRAKRR